MRDAITLTWTVIAAVGVVVQTILIYDSFLMLRAAQRANRPANEKSIAVGHIRSGICFLIVHALFFTIGLAVIFLWNVGRFFGWAFIAAATLILFVGVANYVQRVYVRRRLTNEGE